MYQDVRTLRAGFNPLNLSSGTIAQFYSSSATINNLTVTTLVDAHAPCLNVQNFGATGNGSTDDTSAFQSALDSLPAGGCLELPHPSTAYKITSQLTLNVNRVRIKGEGSIETNINYTPTASGTTAFSIGASLDNVTFEGFAITQTNPTSFPNTTAFTGANGSNRIMWSDIAIASFGRFGINIVSCNYTTIYRCRFIRVRDTTSTNVARAITGTSNVITIQENQFSENDQDISMVGTNVRVINNVTELAGDSGNSLIDRTMNFNTVNNLIFGWNYVEGADTNGGDFLRCTNCVEPLIIGNYFNGQDANVDLTDDFLRFDGASSMGAVVCNNTFLEMKGLFIDNSGVAVRAFDNKWTDGGVTFSSRSVIMTKINLPELVDLDVTEPISWDPPSVSSGTSNLSTAFSVTGSSTTDQVEIHPPYSLQGLLHSGYVENSTGTVRIVLGNLTTAAVNLSTGTWRVRIKKA